MFYVAKLGATALYLSRTGAGWTPSEKRAATFATIEAAAAIAEKTPGAMPVFGTTEEVENALLAA